MHQGFTTADARRNPRRRAGAPLRTLAALLVGAALVACAPVKPYQRGIHSKRIMQTDPDPAEQKLDTHTHEIREGSMADPSLSGGGCGCN